MSSRTSLVRHDFDDKSIDPRDEILSSSYPCYLTRFLTFSAESAVTPAFDKIGKAGFALEPRPTMSIPVGLRVGTSKLELVAVLLYAFAL